MPMRRVIGNLGSKWKLKVTAGVGLQGSNLATDPELQDFLRSGSGMGSTQPMKK
jgi:hypothetical protein